MGLILWGMEWRKPPAGSKRDSPDIVITSDVSRSWGCGAFWQQKWFQCSWHVSWEIVDILAKELLPIVIAPAIWSKAWEGCTLLCCCSNVAVVAFINAGYCKHETAMRLLRCLFFIAAHFNFDLFGRYILVVIMLQQMHYPVIFYLSFLRRSQKQSLFLPQSLLNCWRFWYTQDQTACQQTGSACWILFLPRFSSIYAAAV